MKGGAAAALLLCASLGFAFGGARSARAASAPANTPAPGSPPAEPSKSSPKRSLPNYDGRKPEPASFSDIALWIPRVLLSPFYLVAEFGLREPLGVAIPAAERAGVPQTLYDFFLFGPDHRAGFIPIAFVDFGFRPSVGLYAFWDDALARGQDLRVHGSTSGSDWLAGTLTDRLRFNKTDSLTFELSGIHRPDHAFFGLGSNSRQQDISRYGATLYRASAAFDLAWSRTIRIGSALGVHSESFYPGHFGSDPSLETRAASGTFPIPPGFASYTAATTKLSAAVDTRSPRPAPGSGVRVEADSELGTDVRQSNGARYLRYGGTAVGFLDLNGRNRVLSLAVTALFSDPLGDAPVPFTELVTLGGPGPMRGFYPGRLVDRSAAVATVKYRWPIWVWLDGSLQVATGNVFDRRLENFSADRLRLSSAIGIESVGSRDSSFELLFGIGSETFDHGAQIDSFRFLIGSNHGF
ncbi:MAG TPA: BamA/TamA family outer membrane protein [Polyangiaceae bacterium]|jgi:hypothetical protein|nr:BamA/TamA family outer membrane protein [Polyangiaceae bacterium]